MTISCFSNNSIKKTIIKDNSEIKIKKIQKPKVLETKNNYSLCVGKL